MNTNLYLDFIKSAIATEGYRVADIANKKALELQEITTDQYLSAARLIVKAYLEN